MSVSGGGGRETGGAAAREREFDWWLAPFWEALGDRRQQRWGPVYVRDLLGAGDGKSVAPIAARAAPDDYGQPRYFVDAATWDDGPLARELAAEKAEQFVSGPEAVLIADDTALLNQGTHSADVGRQYAGAASKAANRQALVSLTLTRGDGYPVWCRSRSHSGCSCPRSGRATPRAVARPTTPTSDPDVRIPPRTARELALDEIDRVRAAGVTFGRVLVGAGFGASAEFGRALTMGGLTWAVGIPKTHTVHPPDAARGVADVHVHPVRAAAAAALARAAIPVTASPS